MGRGKPSTGRCSPVTIGQLWDQSLASEGLTAAGAWLGLAAYAFQIYFDFSGYSDMAKLMVWKV